MTVRRGARRWLVAALVAGVLAPSVAVAPGAAADPAFPHLSGVEMRDFYYARLPSLPGVTPITSPPPILGHAGADARIRHLAEARGYRLQATPSVPLRSYGGLTLAADAGEAWLRVLGAARANGTPIQGNSAYRSVDAQRGIFRRQLEGAGRARVGRPYSAGEIASGAADGAIESVLAYHSIPGYSRHHTGKTIDMSHAGGVNGTFSRSAAYRWIASDNYAVAKHFGFIPNYPPGAGRQGPNPEPWEFSWVGVDAIRCAARFVPLPATARRTCPGQAEIGITRNHDGTLHWHLRTPGQPETVIPYGNPTDTPITGDWDADGRTDIGITRNHDGTLHWHLRTPGQPEAVIPYGNPTDTPITGDWDGR